MISSGVDVQGGNLCVVLAKGDKVSWVEFSAGFLSTKRIGFPWGLIARKKLRGFSWQKGVGSLG